MLLEREPVHSGHPHVGDQATEFFIARRIQEGGGTFEIPGGEALDLEEVAKRLANGPIVIHDRDQ